MSNARIISIVNQKGGVAKTTTAINLAAYLGILGKKVLLIDLDPQGSASSGLGIRKSQKGIYDLLHNNNADVVVQTSEINLSVIPSNQNLAAFEFECANLDQKEMRLKNAIKKFNFDIILIDCPPSLGFLTVNALVASSEILIPVQPEFFALEGLSMLLESSAAIKKKWNEKLEILGIVLTMYDKRNLLHQEVESDIRNYLSEKLFKTIITRNIKLAEAASFGQSVAKYDKLATGAALYETLAKEILERLT